MRRVVGNTAWLAMDQIVRLAVGFVVTVFVARHLGVNQFGQLSYAIAFCAPFAALVSLSINGILVRDIVREPDRVGEILGTALALKGLGGLAAVVFGGVLAWGVREAEPGIRVLVFIVLAGTVLQASDVFDLWFQGVGQARIGAWSRSVAALIMSGLKLALVFTNAPLVFFALASAAEIALCGGLFVVGYFRRSGPRAWSVSIPRATRLLREAWPLAMAGVAFQIQGYFDQILLGGIRGVDELGSYSAALRLVGAIGFIAVAVYGAAAPEVTRAHAADPQLYARRLRDIYRVVLAGSLLLAIPLILFPGPIVNLAFGSSYSDAALLVPLLSLRLIFSNLAVARGLFLTNEGLFHHALVTMGTAAAINIVLNLVLIPSWGGIGCVIAALVSSFVGIVLMDGLQEKARYNLRILAAALGLARLSR